MPIRWLYITYHLLREPETAIDMSMALFKAILGRLIYQYMEETQLKLGGIFVSWIMVQSYSTSVIGFGSLQTSVCFWGPNTSKAKVFGSLGL